MKGGVENRDSWRRFQLAWADLDTGERANIRALLNLYLFQGNDGAGLGAGHQIGWTGLVAKTIQLFGLLDGKTALEVGKQAALKK